jgi:hypothetical protein
MQLTQEQIEFLDRVVERGDWTLNSNGGVDVDGDVDLSFMNLTEIPVKFGKVTGSFDCDENKLTTLKNVPDWVGGSFYCSDNKLTSLEGCPDYVGEDFYCNYNNLKVYFKNIKEEDFKHLKKVDWFWVLEEYPFLINIAKNYVGKENFIKLIEGYPKTKLYLK